MSRPQWHGTGHQQEATPHRQQLAEDTLEREYAYAVAAGVHLWVVTVAHKATEQLLDAYDGRTDAPPMLDVDTLLMRPALGCYVCEQPYDQRARRRRCPGEPKAGHVTPR